MRRLSATDRTLGGHLARNGRRVGIVGGAVAVAGVRASTGNCADPDAGTDRPGLEASARVDLGAGIGAEKPVGARPGFGARPGASAGIGARSAARRR